MKPEYWGTGVPQRCSSTRWPSAHAKGYQWIDLSITSEDNPQTPLIAEHMGATIYKRWRTYRSGYSKDSGERTGERRRSPGVPGRILDRCWLTAHYLERRSKMRIRHGASAAGWGPYVVRELAGAATSAAVLKARTRRGSPAMALAAGRSQLL